MNHGRYRQLLVMAALSFISMYVLMYAMANSLANVFSNVNQTYMAGLMTAPMVLFELAIMRGMYPSRRRNALILAVTAAAGIACFVLLRQQTGVSDRQFLRSMIPHHAGAILMCKEASIRDPEIRDLCRSIMSSQQAEIDQMKAKLYELQE